MSGRRGTQAAEGFSAATGRQGPGRRPAGVVAAAATGPRSRALAPRGGLPCGVRVGLTAAAEKQLAAGEPAPRGSWGPPDRPPSCLQEWGTLRWGPDSLWVSPSLQPPSYGPGVSAG